VPDSFTDYLNLTKPEIGGSRDAWGPKLNDAFDKIDAWAKVSNTKTEKSLNAKDDLAQGVAGAVTFAKKTTHTLGASFGAAIDAAGNSKFGTVEVSGGAVTVYGAEGNDEKGSVSLNKAGTRGIIWNVDRYSLPGADLYVNGQKAFTAGNLDPAKYIDKTVTNRQSVSGPLAATALEFVKPNVLRGQWIVSEDGRINLLNGDSGDTFLTIGQDGSVSTKQFGDLNTRIEDRARAYAEDRANQMGNQRVVATALQGSWGLQVPSGATVTAPHPGVVTTIQTNVDGKIINMFGRFMYFNTPNLGWVGAYTI